MIQKMAVLLTTNSNDAADSNLPETLKNRLEDEDQVKRLVTKVLFDF